MKVGILTLPLHNNYGGIIQAAALFRVLSDMGHDPILLNKKYWRPLHHRILGPVLRAIPGHDIKNSRTQAAIRARHQSFMNRFLHARSPLLFTKQALEKYVKRSELDAVVVGSDQVWRPSYIEDIDTGSYFLDFKGSFRKISYAASFGHNIWTKEDRISEVRRMIAGFDHVSLRELSGVELTKSVLGRENCRMVIDPTLLVDPSFYEDVMGHGGGSSNYILNYVLDEGPVVQCVVQSIIEASNQRKKIKKITLDDNANSNAADLPQWLRSFRDADFVVTDSFHGTVFSILFRKQFVCVGNEERGLDRFQSLLSLLNLEDRLVVDKSEVSNVTSTIDYEQVETLLNGLRDYAMAFLSEALGEAA